MNLTLDSLFDPKTISDDPNFGFGAFLKISVQVTFWGDRLVTIPGGPEGSYSLNQLAKNVEAASRIRIETRLYPKDPASCQFYEKFSHTLDERVYGFYAINFVESLYQASDEQIQSAHWFTRILAWFKDWNSSTWLYRARLKEAKTPFKAFKESEFLSNGFNMTDRDGSIGIVYDKERNLYPTLVKEETILQKQRAINEGVLVFEQLHNEVGVWI